MRFSYAHKMSTYLMTWCAYFALVLSGELSELVVIVSLVGIGVSWLWEPPRIRYDTFTLPWTILSALVLGGTVFSLLTGGDVLLLGAEFLIYLVVAKLYNRRACKDYQQIYILSFLMLVAGTVLNTEFTYGVFFLGYVIAATWALILFHLRREMEDNFLLKHASEQSSERVEVARILNSKRIVGRRFFLGTAVVSLTIFFAATLMFLMIPRIGFGLFFNKNRAGLSMAGFSDGVQLGGHGLIKTDKTVVMRVKVDDVYEGRKAPYIHWRGVAFDRYENGRWRRTRRSPFTRRTITFWNRKEQHHLLYTRAGYQPSELATRMRRGMKQEIYLEPLGYDVLFGASMPTVFEFEPKWGQRSARKDHNDEIRLQHAAGTKYTVYSNLDRPSPATLRAAPKRLPPGFGVYTQLPRELPVRVRDKAREITRGLTSDYDKAIAIETWLKENLSYTLRMKSPGDQEPIDFFLFTRKKGHCEYFSSAMAVMARAVHLPTRNVNGFLGGEWNEYDNYIAVRAGDAHSWVEVYFDGVGWVTFDPTPPAEIDALGRGSSGIRAKMRRFFDTLRFKWFKWVIEYDLHRQLSVFRSMGKSLRGSAAGIKKHLARVKAWVKHRRRAIGWFAGAIAVVLVFIALWRRRRRGQPLLPTVRRARKRDAIASLYLSVLARLAKAGHGRAPATTPREHAARLDRQGAPGGKALCELTELYYAAEYGDAASPELLARAEALRNLIEDALHERKQRSGKRGAT